LAAAATSYPRSSDSTYQNPIIPGFNPDPSICRVGADYYLVTSTFEYFPGVPVYHSRDLVHWKMIGHALDRPSQLDLDSIACSGGIYAPTIRYNKGTFYMITTLVGQSKSPQQRNFIVTAKNPAGPWSEPHWIADAPGIDPSLFFDDNGKVYYSGNDSPKVRLWEKHRNIWVQELDIAAWKLVGKRVDVLDGAEYYKKGTLDGGIESGVNNYEASHLYKKDGKYYLLIAHGGTSQNHAVSIWRSDDVFGPYEMNPRNPILTHRDLSKEHAFTSTGHADLVETQRGDWVIVYLAKRPYGGENHIMGRETFMSPVEWSGVWPVVNPKGTIGRGELTHQVPLPTDNTFIPETAKDEFTGPSLRPSWTFIRTPRSEWWSLTQKKGSLRIGLRPGSIADQVNPSFIGRRQEHKNFSAVVKMEFTPRSVKEEAGVAIERDRDNYCTFTIGMEDGKKVVRLSRKAGPETSDSLLAKTPAGDLPQFLKISSDGTRFSFSYSGNGREWTPLRENVDGRFLGVATAGRFTGTFIGMYASAHGTKSTNYADFDWFSYEAAHDPVTLPRFITDGMVLQRNMPIPVWGWAQPGETVHVTFLGVNYSAVADADRKWSVKLKPAKAGGPFDMTISGGSTITLHNILIGDVWFCSGQSNMEFEMAKAQERYPKEIAASANDNIRQFLVKRRVSFDQLADVESDEGWQAANPRSVLKFTAVGYFFAKELYEKYHVPIGLINCTYGGTPAEAWMSDDAVKEFPAYYAKAMEYKDTARVNAITLNDNRSIEKWYSGVNSSDSGSIQRWSSPATDVSGWSRMQMPNFWQEQGLKDVDGGVVWFQREFTVPAALAGRPAVLRMGNIIMRDSTFVNGTYVGGATNKYTPRKYAVAGPLLTAGKNVITVRVLNESGDGGFIKDKPYAIEIGGTSISLAGEWRVKLAVSAKPLLRDEVTRFQVQPTAMYHGMLAPLIGVGIKGVIWYQGESNVSRANEYRTLFPALITRWRKEWRQGDFPFLYVQLANINKTKAEPAESKLAELQEAQSLALSLPNTGMAVANDIGEWNDVHPLNKAEVGRRLFLAAQKVAYGEKKCVSSGPSYTSMTIDGNKIILTFSNIGGGLAVKGGGELKYFSIAGADKKFVWAQAKIVGRTIVVWNDAVTAPVAVRYAWADNPAGANFTNKEGLPASCFRTDR
jgi:sialate O-acetylesterase